MDNLANTGGEVPSVQPSTPESRFVHLRQGKVTMKELTETLSRAKLGKAVGPDEILMEYLKFAPPNVIKTMLELINSIFVYALYPRSWTKNFLKPIYKNGPIDDPGNYRGLAIGSAIAKLYSTILLQRLEDYIIYYIFYRKIKLVSEED